MSNERLENPGPSPLTEGLKRKRGRPKKQPQVSAYRPQSLPELPSVNLVGSAGSKEQGKARFCVVNIKAIQESSSTCALGYQPLVSEELQCPHGKLLRPGDGMGGAAQVSAAVWRLLGVPALCLCTSRWKEGNHRLFSPCSRRYGWDPRNSSISPSQNVKGIRGIAAHLLVCFSIRKSRDNQVGSSGVTLLDFLFIAGGGCGTTAGEKATRKAKRKQESEQCNWTNGNSEWLVCFTKGRRGAGWISGEVPLKTDRGKLPLFRFTFSCHHWTHQFLQPLSRLPQPSCAAPACSALPAGVCAVWFPCGGSQGDSMGASSPAALLPQLWLLLLLVL